MTQERAPSIRILVFRVGQAPIPDWLRPDDKGGHLDAMQKLVGGFVECTTLDDGIDCWSNEDGIALGLLPNRTFPTTGRGVPAGFEGAFVIDATDGGRPDLGAPAEWRILGDFFLARSHDGELADLTEEDIARYTKRFADEDAAAVRAAFSSRVAP